MNHYKELTRNIVNTTEEMVSKCFKYGLLSFFRKGMMIPVDNIDYT